MRTIGCYLIPLVPTIELLWLIVFRDYIPMWGWTESGSSFSPQPDGPDGGLSCEAGGAHPAGLNFSIFLVECPDIC
jgi:hypothetical protein